MKNSLQIYLLIPYLTFTEYFLKCLIISIISSQCSLTYIALKNYCHLLFTSLLWVPYSQYSCDKGRHGIFKKIDNLEIFNQSKVQEISTRLKTNFHCN